MKIYFLSARPCALTLNGVFFGITDTFERSAEITLRDRVYAKFSPENAESIGFFITENIRTSPPEGCEVYLLPDGIAVYACDFPPVDLVLRPIAQARENELLITVFQQGRIQLAVESPDGFFNATLPPSFEKCEITLCAGVILLHSDHALAVFNKNCECMLMEQILSFSVSDNLLSATLPLSDSLGRVAECAWELSENACTQTKFTLRQTAENGTVSESTREGLLAYAFFESVLLKADHRAFLSEALLPDAEKIVAFLGEFVAVTLTDKPNVCGLVRKKAERLFRVDHFTVEIENGKITDVKG